MSYTLNSLQGDYLGDFIGVIKGDTGSLDYASYSDPSIQIMPTLARACKSYLDQGYLDPYGKFRGALSHVSKVYEVKPGILSCSELPGRLKSLDPKP